MPEKDTYEGYIHSLSIHACTYRTPIFKLKHWLATNLYIQHNLFVSRATFKFKLPGFNTIFDAPTQIPTQINYNINQD